MTINTLKALGIFCGSNIGNSPLFAQGAIDLANQMAQEGIRLIYGGAKVGLMGIIANQMLTNGAEVIGVIPEFLQEIELAHRGLTELHVVKTMNERKELIAELSDGFIMLPGGSGSLDEFFEVHTTAQLNYHHKPCGILNLAGYYDLLLQFLDQAVVNGFLKATHRDIILVEDNPDELLRRMRNYQAPTDMKWIKSLTMVND